jgi:hypothetical protein
VQDLNYYANLAEILGTLTIVGGAAFAVFQLAEFRGQRADMVAVELMREFYNADFARAVTMIKSLPDDISAAELLSRGADYEQASFIIGMTYETMGLLVYRRIASFDLAQELTGGLIDVMWRKLHVWVETVRAEQAHPRFAEWFEWLAIQFAKPDNRSDAAYVAYRNWTPRA